MNILVQIFVAAKLAFLKTKFNAKKLTEESVFYKKTLEKLSRIYHQDFYSVGGCPGVIKAYSP